MNKKEKRQIDCYNAESFNQIVSFINSSRKWLDVISSLSFEKKQKMLLSIADIAEVASNMATVRQLEILSLSTQITAFQQEIRMLENISKDLPCHNDKKKNRISCMFEKHRLHERISTLRNNISHMESSIASFQSELDTYLSALQICSEFSRRLKFFLEYEGG